MSDARGCQPSPTAKTLAFAGNAVAMLGTYYAYDSIGPVAELLSQQLKYSDTQIGSLNAIYSLPNILTALLGGVLVDRFGIRAVIICTSIICLAGAVLTAVGYPYPVMLLGRLLFGTGAETLMLAIMVALAQWFTGRHLALFFAVTVSLGRLGSYLADRSPSFASTLYERGWQPPLWLAAGAAAIAFAGACVYWVVEKRAAARGTLSALGPQERLGFRDLLRFRAEYWYLVGLCVAFYTVIFPFRSTFAIKYFQETRALTLQDASRMNSYVFMAAMVVMPAFGVLVDRFGRHALLMMVGALPLPIIFFLLGCTNVDLWIPTALLGLSTSVVAAVLWPSVAQYASPEQHGTAYGVMTSLQNLGLILGNLFVGQLNDHSLASAMHPEGYDPMLWFFGLLGLAAFLFALLLQWRDRSAFDRHSSPRSLP